MSQCGRDRIHGCANWRSLCSFDFGVGVTVPAPGDEDAVARTAACRKCSASGQDFKETFGAVDLMNTFFDASLAKEDQEKSQLAAMHFVASSKVQGRTCPRFRC